MNRKISDEAKQRDWVRPALVLVAALVITVSLWMLQERSYRDRLKLETEVTADQAGNRLADWLQDRMNLSAYLAEKWESEYAQNPEHFIRDAEQFTQRFPGFQAINWVDPDQVIRIVVPREPNKAVENADLHAHPDPEVRDAIARAFTQKRLTRTSATIDLLQGGKGFATYRPIFSSEGKCLGFVNAVFRVSDLLDACLGRLKLDQQFEFSIRESDGELVYPVDERSDFMVSAQASIVSVEVAGRAWSFYLAPSPSYLRQRRIAAHHLILPVGLVAAILLAGFEHVLSRRKRALESSRARYRALFEQAPVAYFTVQPNSTITRANKVAEGITGYGGAALSGMSIYDLCPEHGRARTQARMLLEAVRRDDGVRGDELQMRRASGDLFWGYVLVEAVYADDARFELYRITITDTTERREAEEVRRRLSAAIEQAEEGVIITDQDGGIIYINRVALGFHADSVAEVSGLLLEVFLRRQQADPATVKAVGAAIRGEGRWRGAYSIPNREGKPVNVAATLSPVRDESGSATGFVLLQRDVSYEAELFEQLQQAQKMEAIGRLAGGIAHDFNNILQSLLGYAALARRNAGDAEEVTSCLNEIEQAGCRAADLVSHILAFGRQSVVQRRPLLLQPIVEEVSRLVRGSLPDGLDLDVHFGEIQLPVIADPTQVHQVLMNLASNALHALRGRTGSLQIRLDAIDLDEEDAHRWPALHPGTHMRLTVEDTGPGMDQSTLQRVFEPYFTTRDVGTGTGLGLATVHGLIEQHGGAIWADSEPEKGACFTIYLPAVPPLEPDPDHPDLPSFQGEGSLGDISESDSGRRVRVLYVDDDAQIVDSMRRVLDRLGFDVEGYTSSPAALDAFRATPEMFDLLVTDLSMPVMDGMALAEEVQRIRVGLPTILCSGFGESFEREVHDKRRIINTFLKKPVSARVLANEINALTRGSQFDS